MANLILDQYHITEETAASLRVPAIAYPSDRVPLNTARQCFPRQFLKKLPITDGTFSLDDLMRPHDGMMA